MENLDLFLRLKNNDPTAVKEYMDLYSDLLYIISFKILKTQDEAQDAVVHAFTTLWFKRNDINNDSVKYYLVTTVKNKCLDILRQRKTQKNILPVIKQNYYSDEPKFSDNDLIYAEVISELNKEINNLPSEMMQKIFKMKYLEQKNPNEIAEILSLTPKTIYNSIAAAKKKLTENISKKKKNSLLLSFLKKSF